MSRTLLVLSPRLGAVVPAAALPALRAADRVLADHSVPAEVVTEAGAEPLTSLVWPAGSCVLLTTDAAHPMAASADSVLAVAEPPGAALLEAVAVMDRLRSPGGCPWDAEQTHLSLLKYLVEECYELYQAVEDADRSALREELGDVLLQVLFHARVAAEGGVDPFPAGADSEPFGIDEVAEDLVRKLVDRHPHVFPPRGRDRVAPSDQVRAAPGQTGTAPQGVRPALEQVRTAADQEVRWDELKRAEKRRESSVDGVALSQPAAALAAKLVSRARKAGLPADLPRRVDGPAGTLFHQVAKLTWAGADPEHELRRAALGFAASVRAAETAARAAGLDPHRLSADDWQRFWPREPA
jgi:XTP/dITP diphosphohydrolase